MVEPRALGKRALVPIPSVLVRNSSILSRQRGSLSPFHHSVHHRHNCRGALNRFAHSATEGVVQECCGKAGDADPSQLISRVRGIRRRHPGTGGGSQVPVQVIRDRVGPERHLLIVEIAIRRGARRRC